MPPTMHAPRRKSCQAVLTDGETPCSRTFRGWGRYCPVHLEECAKLSGQYKDAFARTERLRRHGELSARQLRLTTTPAAQRAVEKAQQYLAAIEEEMRTRTVHFTRFPAEKDERHQQRLAVLEERKAACATLITQLQQHCDATGQQRRQGDLERQPLLGTAPRQQGSVRWTLWIAFFVVLSVPLIYWFVVLSRIELEDSPAFH